LYYLEDYRKAMRMGQRNYRECVSKGVYPYLQVLDDLLKQVDVEYEQPIGVVEIPADRIAGTKAKGRRSAFSRSFMPLLKDDTEFARKWMTLFGIQMTEGIRDPIKVYEFMNRFYVQEGNKRVSVLKYLGATSIWANVTRVVPVPTESKENRIYYEFMDFYDHTRLNYFWFTEEGRFSRLLAATGPVDRPWNENERKDLASVYLRFAPAFRSAGGEKLSVTASDALLAYIDVYGYDAVKEKTTRQMSEDLARIWKEVLVLNEQEAVELSMSPSPEQTRGLFNKILPMGPSHLKVAFLNERTPATSAWTYAHDFGRSQLEETFGNRVETLSFNDVLVGEDAQQKLEQAVNAGCDVVFTTTPKLMADCLKAAVKYPHVKFLNCSLNMTHPDVRTYYGRIHEAKFLLGAIAGAIADDNKIGYVATYPTYGMTAGINAFALGAKMTNPRAKIYLEWTAVKDCDVEASFREKGVHVVSDIDLRAPDSNAPREFGLYRVGDDGREQYLAMPFWHWGEFYIKIVQSIFDGRWKEDGDQPGTHAINYWWGMSAGVVEVITSRSLPEGTARLVELLRRAICSSEFEPFAGVITDQNGQVRLTDGQRFEPEDIITMDWLADNVVGRIPEFDELIDAAKPMVHLQGVTKEGEGEK
jgi:basic membrane lipoprotein Med (substrate-binding protein (PBP1-ABC) superfamily)